MKVLLTIVLLFMYGRETDGSKRPMDLMADLTNDLGVCILQVQSALQNGNIAFSPYGLASMSVLLFEGATGNTALEIMRVMKLPWNTLLVRVGFRDINRHLKTYFKSDGFLRGLIMSRDDVCFHPSYQKLLRLYGFDEPDTALTYPCSGFVPYSPPTTVSTDASTTTTAVTASSPNATNESTTSSTNTTSDVVTEITQTSQTITISNTTISTPVNINTENAAPIVAKTESSLDNNLEIESEAASETRSTTALQTSSNTPVSLLDNTGAHANMITVATVNGDPLMIPNITKSLEMETAETVITNNRNSMPMVMPQKNLSTTGSTEALSTSTSRTFTMSIPKITDKETTTTVRPISMNFSTTIKQDFSSQEDERSTTINFDDFLYKNNLTIKLGTKVKFPQIDTKTTIDKLFNNTVDIFTGPDAFTEEYFNFSTINYWNISDEISTVTLPSVFNDSSETEINFNNFRSVTPIDSLDTKLNFNKTSTFYSTLVNFIENTTQKIKDFINFDDRPSTTESVTFTKTVPTTSSNPLSLKTNENSTTFKNSSNSGTSTRTSMQRLNEKNLPNMNKRTAEEDMGFRVLPKKSISENNEDSNMASSVDYILPTKPPSYFNVLSLRKSKLISSKYDIQSAKSYEKKVFKRSVPLVETNNTTNEYFGEKLDIAGDNLKNTTQISKTFLANMVGYNPSELMNGVNVNGVPMSISLHADTVDRFFSSISGQFTDPSKLSNDFRQSRSYSDQEVYPYNLNWFITSNQNVIQTTIFTYSAILPFAYIDELKSKVLEIPLDDPNYTLLLLLPTNKFGLNYLLTSLSQWPIRRIWECLRATPVYASIPKFSIISHINLRPALFALGVRDVFYRYRADLSVMSPDARLYVRSIEQVVTVRVDKFPSSVYPVLEKYTKHNFLASHPFLYFVLDRETGVSLVAGIMADPSKHII